MVSESVVVWQLMQPALFAPASAAVCFIGAGGAAPLSAAPHGGALASNPNSNKPAIIPRTALLNRSRSR
jgi:hypothetical protein